MSPPAFLDSCNGQSSSFKSSYAFSSFHNDMNSSSSNSNYGFRNSNETNSILGFNSPPIAASRNPRGATAAGSGSNLSRPRLMKMRRQTSHNPRSTTTPGSFRGEEADVPLGFNPFRTESESVFANSSSGNVPKRAFSFGAGSSNNPSSISGSERGVPSVVLDDLRKLKIDGDKSYPNATGANAAFNFKVFESENKKSFDECMVDQLPKEINKLNIGGSGNLGSTKSFRDVNPTKSRFTDKFHTNVEAELQHEMHKMNLGNPRNVGWGSDNMKSFVFGRNSNAGERSPRRSGPVNPGKQHDEEKVKADLISERMGELKVSGARDDNMKSFVFGKNSTTGDALPVRSEPVNRAKQRNEMDRMPELKVGGAGEASGFSTAFNDKMRSGTFLGKNLSFDQPKVYETTSSSHFGPFGNAPFTGRSERNVEFTFTSKLDNLGAPNVDAVKDARLKKKKGKLRKPAVKDARLKKKKGKLSPDTRQHKKKHRLKTGQDSYASSSSAEFFPMSGNSSILSPGKTQKVDLSPLSSKNKDNFKPINEQDSKHGTFSTPSASIAAEEACEKWRLRGNQAYGNGDLAKAEDYYTQGLNAVSQTEKSKSCLRALMLCYSNRAATRISLGKMREALKDCLMAAAIDPNFLKVQVRAAHCYLAIGEVENATLQYMKCLQSGNDVCVDRKLLVEASEGLEKAQKVTECVKQYTELPRRTSDDLECASRVIDEALQISSYSEQLLQMKADTLFMLRRYEQVIQMCEQTLSSVEMDAPTSSSSWRSNLIVKSYFYLGRLEEALEFIKKQESSGQITERLGSMSLESVIPLADTVCELLSRKAAGNESYKSGRYAEAVEHYTAALSCSVESRPFAAICFCNRAAAYRALGQITDAIADCSLAIALDPSYLKALSRRASLYEMIRDYGQAAIDLRRLVFLLTSQIEEKGILSGVSDKSSGVNELRQTQLRLYNIEEESRKEIPLNVYLILGVESTAAASEVKKAYRKAALKHHPDKAALSLSRSDNGDDGLWKEIAENVYKDADRLFKMIGEAYAVLSNPSKRSRYDQDEEMRNEANRLARSSSGRMAADVQSPVFERSGSRRGQDSWRPYVHTQSKGQEKTTTSSYRYSRHS